MFFGSISLSLECFQVQTLVPKQFNFKKEKTTNFMYHETKRLLCCLAFLLRDLGHLSTLYTVMETSTDFFQIIRWRSMVSVCVFSHLFLYMFLYKRIIHSCLDKSSRVKSQLCSRRNASKTITKSSCPCISMATRSPWLQKCKLWSNAIES